MAKTFLRKEMMLSEEEVDVLRFAMACTGLDMTTTMRLMIRRGILELIAEQRRTGVPKLPDRIMDLVEGL